MGDLAGSMWAAVGILAALHRRGTTGPGEHVDVSLLDSLISWLSYLAQLYLVTGESPPRMGSSHHTVPAYGRYAVRDGHLVLAAQMDAFWGRFCEAAGRPELASDARYRTVADRRQRFEEVDRLVAEILRTRDLAEWSRLLDEADVPGAPVLDVGEALGQPQARHRGLRREVVQPGVGPIDVLGPVVKFASSAGPDELTPAADLGEHTRQVLIEICNFSPTAVDELIRSGAASEPGASHPGGAPASRRPATRGGAS